MTEASRRGFLGASAGGVSAAWLTAMWPQGVKAAEEAHKMGAFTFFTREQAALVDAMAAQIFPTDDKPGAKEAQVIYFIDVALVTYAQNKQKVYTEGFEQLQAKTKEVFPAAASFAALSSAQQIELLHAIEKTEFFRAVREHTITGMFSAPQHGGNYGKVGWKMIGFDDSLNFREPFGYYDR
jgi:gluconate 2-dehydrogenase gamma chain